MGSRCHSRLATHWSPPRVGKAVSFSENLVSRCGEQILLKHDSLPCPHPPGLHLGRKRLWDSSWLVDLLVCGFLLLSPQGKGPGALTVAESRPDVAGCNSAPGPTLCVRGAGRESAGRSLSASVLQCGWTPDAGIGAGRRGPLVLSRGPLECVGGFGHRIMFLSITTELGVLSEQKWSYGLCWKTPSMGWRDVGDPDLGVRLPPLLASLWP